MTIPLSTHRLSIDDTHENNDTGATVASLDANALGHVLDFLPLADCVRLLSTCRGLAQRGLANKLETACGKCGPCHADVKHLCRDAPERKWTSRVWKSVLNRHGHSLTELHLVGCAQVSPDVFSSRESRRMLQTLRILRIDSCTALDARSLQTLLTRCHRLSQVHIVNMPLDDAGLAALLTSSRDTLREVDLTGCHMLEGRGLHALRDTQVDKITVEGCHRIKMAELTAMLATCQGLRSLNLQFCHNVDDELVQAIATFHPTLEHLNLRYCVRLSDVGVRALCSTMTALKTLDLSQCPRITDQAVFAISKSLVHLQTLKLWNCRQVTATLTLPSLNLNEWRRSPVKVAARASNPMNAAWEPSDHVGLFTRQCGHRQI